MFKPQTDRREVQERNTAIVFLSYFSMFHWPRSASQTVRETISAAHTANLLGHNAGWAGERWDRWKIQAKHKMGDLASGDTETRAPSNTYSMIRCQNTIQNWGGGILSTTNKDVALKWMTETAAWPWPRQLASWEALGSTALGMNISISRSHKSYPSSGFSSHVYRQEVTRREEKVRTTSEFIRN